VADDPVAEEQAAADAFADHATEEIADLVASAPRRGGWVVEHRRQFSDTESVARHYGSIRNAGR
jgi:hypothetical protein